MKKTAFSVGKLELSRDFVLFMVAFGILITILLYNPNEIRTVLLEIKNIGQEILKLGEQSTKLGEQGINNTEKIINDSAKRFNISSERNIKIIDQLSNFINQSEQERQASGLDIIKIMFLYLQDQERDINKIMDSLNITNQHYITVNGTHAITESGAIKLPYPINISGDDGLLDELRNKG